MIVDTDWCGLRSAPRRAEIAGRHGRRMPVLANRSADRARRPPKLQKSVTQITADASHLHDYSCAIVSKLLVMQDRMFLHRLASVRGTGTSKRFALTGAALGPRTSVRLRGQNNAARQLFSDTPMFVIFPDRGRAQK
jgi:hypothetical protein